MDSVFTYFEEVKGTIKTPENNIFKNSKAKKNLVSNIKLKKRKVVTNQSKCKKNKLTRVSQMKTSATFLHTCYCDKHASPYWIRNFNPAYTFTRQESYKGALEIAF